ncbi:MAG: Lar family restriction alleviation protein [Candidatus Jordarchaeaceae archaeon]
MTEIKPCPFCGNKGELVLYTLDDDEDKTNAWGWAVVCNFCRAEGPPIFHIVKNEELPDHLIKKSIKSAQKEAIRRWNMAKQDNTKRGKNSDTKSTKKLKNKSYKRR